MLRTFIFFDLETTGLITKTTMPKITELSLVAVSRTAICDTTDSLPRVSRKLVLPIHPGTQISTYITKLTGLSDENLENVQHFNCETYTLINSFLKQLIAPMCFVAYNGNFFDYPIFLSELSNIDKVFDNDILSIDMLNLVKDFFLNKNNSIKELNNATCIASSSFHNIENAGILLNDDNDELLSEALDNFNNSQIDSSDDSESINLGNNNTVCLNSSLFERTPESQKISINSKRCKESTDGKDKSTIKRRLVFTKNQILNFKLPTVYEHFWGELPENAHSAEGDCLTMIRCAIKLGNFFVQWADSNARPLISYSRQ